MTTENSIIEDNCSHSWALLTPATGVQQDSKYLCSKCNTIMTASEVFQLRALENQDKTLKHLRGFERWISVIALIISLLALLVSIFKIKI